MTPDERDLLYRAAYFGDACAKCGRAFGPDEPVYRWQYASVLNIVHAPVCAACNGDTQEVEEWHESPCDGCGRPVFNNHIRSRRWTVCSQRCRIRIETHQRREKRQASRAQKICVNCGTAFSPKRSDAHTCRPACRQALYRRRSVTDSNLWQVATRQEA